MNPGETSPAGQHPGQHTPPPPQRILVVDDDPCILQINTEVLMHQGYEVEAAEDGEAGWDALHSGGHNLLITDHNMPKLSGLKLIRRVRAACMNLPIILATGQFPQSEFTPMPRLQPWAVLLKPYTVAELVGTVKRVLSAADSAMAGAQILMNRDLKNSQTPHTSKPDDALAQSRTSASRRILVVDDDREIRQCSAHLLAVSGYDVTAVTDGAAGWEAIQAGNYDLILTDNKMPKMTGVEMIEKLHAACRAVPVIMATGYLPTHEFDRQPWLTPDAMLQRPFSQEALLEAVRKILCEANGASGCPPPARAA